MRTRDDGAKDPPLRPPRIRTWFGATGLAMLRSASVWLPFGLALKSIEVLWERYGPGSWTLRLGEDTGAYSWVTLDPSWITTAWLLAVAAVTARRALVDVRLPIGASALGATRALPRCFLTSATHGIAIGAPLLAVGALPVQGDLRTVVGIGAGLVAVWLAAVLFVGPVAAVRQDLGPLRAALESARLTRGVRWAIAGQVLTWLVFAVAVSAVGQWVLHDVREDRGLANDLLVAWADLPIDVVLAYIAVVIWEDRRGRLAPPDADDLAEIFA